MSNRRGRPKLNYDGRKFGLVTVVRREPDGRLWCLCSCGVFRHLELANLISHPPKSHQKCVAVNQYELDL